ncbi:MAG: amidase [Acetobacterales bacterium]
MTDLHWLSLAEAAALIRGGKLSPVEYAQALIDRAERYDGLFDSFLRKTPEIALEEAKRAEAEIAGGTYRGPLHGIPYGLKDIMDYAGLPTTGHSKILIDNVAKRDATVTAKLREAGGALMGKMATHEFALGGPSFDLPWPPARNPWNRDHFTGGSSSGSGAALAAGFLPAALGSDTGGSVRNPASLCGIVGLKPTYGRVSRAGVLPLSYSLDNVGPMTRTVEDNALLLNVIAGYDERDPASARVAVPDFTHDLRKGVKGLRVAVIRHFYAEDMEPHPEVGAGVEAAAKLFEDLGASVGEIRLAPLSAYASCNRNILLSEAFAVHEKWLQERPGDYAESTRRRLMPGAFLRAVDYVQALRLRGRLTRQFNEAMRDFDIAVTVSGMDPAAPIEDIDEVERTYPRQARNAFNVIGAPALAVPVGFTQSRLPLSMQIIGRAFDEATVYRAAWAYEQEAGWSTQRPPIEEMAA